MQIESNENTLSPIQKPDLIPSAEDIEVTDNLEIISKFINGFFSNQKCLPYRRIERSVELLALLDKLSELKKVLETQLTSVFSKELNDKLSSATATESEAFAFLKLFERFMTVGKSIFISFQSRHLIFIGCHSFTEFVSRIMAKCLQQSPDKLNVLFVKFVRIFYDNIKSKSSEKHEFNNLFIFMLEKTKLIGEFSEHYLNYSFGKYGSELNAVDQQNSNTFFECFTKIKNQEHEIYKLYFDKYQFQMQRRINSFVYSGWKKELMRWVKLTADSAQAEITKQVLNVFIQSNNVKVFQDEIATNILSQFESCKDLSDLLDLFHNMLISKHSIFEGQEPLWKEQMLALERNINKSNKIEPEMFARSLNHFVTIGDKNKTHQALKILHTLTDKDRYVKEIYRYFSKAILGNTNTDAFRDIYEELRTVYGDETLKTYRLLLNDIAESEKTANSVRGRVSEKIGALYVIGKGHWPQSDLSNWKLPEKVLEHELQSSANRIREEYLSGSSLKKLDFMTDFSTVEVKISVAGYEQILKMKLKFALIFNAFQNRSDWAVADLSSYLNLPPDLMTKVLESANKKYNCFKSNNGIYQLLPNWAENLLKSTNSNHQELKNKGTKFANPGIQTASKAETIKEMERAIKAFIVHEIKTKDAETESQLCDALSARFKLQFEAADIAPFIEELLSNEFIERRADNANAFKFK